MDTVTLFYRFGAALAIGFLIGLQREFASEDPDQELFAGVRTFSLIAIAGCLAAFLADLVGGPWVFVGIVVPVGTLIALAHFIGAWRRGTTGLTTEFAALITLMIGAVCYWHELALAAALGVAVTVLLSLKAQLHALADRISRQDMFATLKFAVITAIILPVLPNRSFGPAPLDVLNPYSIWLMVVFISGISFLGYILTKVIGPRRGITLTGVLGGLVASTPLTMDFARRSQDRQELARSFAVAILLSWTITFPRVMLEATTLHPPLLAQSWLPLAASGLVGLAYCAYLYFSQQNREQEEVAFRNPFELGTALQFALLYAVVLLASKAAQVYLGDTGLYISSIASGLADADALTLSIAQLSQSGSVGITVAGRALVLGALSNTVVKGGIVLFVGTGRLRRAVLPGILLMLAVGMALAFLA